MFPFPAPRASSLRASRRCGARSFGSRPLGSRPLRSRPRASGRVYVFVLTLGLLWFGTGGGWVPGVTPVQGQAATAQEAQARTRYLLAQAAYRSLEQEARELERVLTPATATVLRERQSGNTRAAQEVFSSTFIGNAFQAMSLDARSRALRSELEARRRTYLQVLDAREAVLIQRLSQNPTAAQRAELNRQIAELREEYLAVERERDTLVEVMIRPLPQVQALRTDTPRDLRDKAQYLENVGRGYDAVIELLDAEIETREKRLALLRGSRDFRAAIGRFGEDRPPATATLPRPGTGRTEDERAAGAPDSGFVLEDLALEDQIGVLRSIRIQAEEAATEVRRQARVFERLAGGGVGGP